MLLLNIKITVDQLAYYQRHLYYLKEICLIKYTYIYERLLVCGFRKGFSALHCIALRTEQWKKAVDNKITAEALLTDQSMCEFAGKYIARALL